MTMGQMIEGFVRRRYAVEGTFCNRTPFEEMDLSSIDNKVPMTSGITGEAMESYGVIDIVHYMVLSHQVIDKI